MKYLYILLALVFLEIILQIGYALIYPKADPFEGRGRESVATDRVICVGDSVVWGVGATSKSKSFPSQLSKLMGHESVRNLGEFSATSEDALSMVRKISRYASGTIIVHAGYNDDKVPSNHGLRKLMIVRLLLKPFPMRKPTVMEFADTISDIYNECKKNGVKVIFLTISTKQEWTRINLMNSRLMDYPNTIRINLKPEHFVNYIHLNDAGYAEMARQVSHGL